VTSVPVAFPTASRPQAWAAGTPLLLLSTLLDLRPGSTDAEVEVPCGIGHVALRVQRD
jgi:glycogen debranching enzyme